MRYKEYSLESPQASNFGLLAEGKRRWCGGCAKAHAGAVDVSSKKCEDCELSQPNFGLPAEGTTRWCGGCAAGHDGAVRRGAKKCENCQLVQPSFGLPSDGKKRWCISCAKGHPGAVNAVKNCEGCELKTPTFGLPAEGKKRWCAGCAEGHEAYQTCKRRIANRNSCMPFPFGGGFRAKHSRRNSTTGSTYQSRMLAMSRCSTSSCHGSISLGITQHITCRVAPWR